MDNRGNVLYYADEDKAGLKGKARPKHFNSSKSKKAKTETITDSEAEESGSDASSQVDSQPRQTRKRKRQDAPELAIEDCDPVPQPRMQLFPGSRAPAVDVGSQARPMVPTATRPLAPRASAAPPELGMAQGYAMPNIAGGSGGHLDVGTQPVYAPPYQRSPVYPPAQQYAQPGIYQPQEYPGAFYPQGGYTPGPWQPNRSPQLVPGWQAPPTAEEMAQLRQIRAQQGRGNGGGG